MKPNTIATKPSIIIIHSVTECVTCHFYTMYRHTNPNPLGGYRLRPEHHHCFFKQYTSPKYGPNMTCFGHLRRCVRTFTTISAWHPNTGQHFRSEQQIREERNRHIRGPLWFTIHPYSLFNFYWRTFMSIVYISTIVAYLETVTMVTKESTMLWSSADIVNLVVNFLSILDILILFFTGYIKQYQLENTMFTVNQASNTSTVCVELNRKYIAYNYLKTFFFVDIICLLAIAERIFLSFFYEVHLVYYLLPLRLVRYSRLFTAFQNIKLVLSKVFKLWYEEIYSIFICVFAFSFCVYFFGCMYILVPRVMYFTKDSRPRNRLAARIRRVYRKSGVKVSPTVIFVHTIFESMVSMCAGKTFLSVDPSYESYWIFTINSVVGMLLRVYIFLVILRILSTSQMSRLKFNSIENSMRSFLKDVNPKKSTIQSLHMFLDNQFKGEYFNENAILRTLPMHLQYEIFLEVSMDLVLNCDLFYGLPNDIMTSLTVKLKFETHMPGVKVISQGEISTCMWFIASGMVAVYGKHGREICHLGDGTYFGEIGLLEQQSPKRGADVVCIEYCQLYRLDKKDFQEVVKPNSEIAQRMQQQATSRLNERRKTSLGTLPRGTLMDNLRRLTKKKHFSTITNKHDTPT